jgi:hypothetical protein
MASLPPIEKFGRAFYLGTLGFGMRAWHSLQRADAYALIGVFEVVLAIGFAIFAYGLDREIEKLNARTAKRKKPTA